MYSAISRTEGGTCGVLTDALQNGNDSHCVRIIERRPQCCDNLLMAGDDGARTRDLCRDSEKEGRNLQKTSVTDGFFWRSKARMVTVIGPLSDPRPLPCRPLPFSVVLFHSFLFIIVMTNAVSIPLRPDLSNYSWTPSNIIRQTMFVKRMCPIDEQFVLMRLGLATITARDLALEIATFVRFLLNRKSTPREHASPELAHIE